MGSKLSSIVLQSVSNLYLFQKPLGFYTEEALEPADFNEDVVGFFKRLCAHFSEEDVGLFFGKVFSGDASKHPLLCIGERNLLVSRDCISNSLSFFDYSSTPKILLNSGVFRDVVELRSWSLKRNFISRIFSNSSVSSEFKGWPEDDVKFSEKYSTVLHASILSHMLLHQRLRENCPEFFLSFDKNISMVFSLLSFFDEHGGGRNFPRESEHVSAVVSESCKMAMIVEALISKISEKIIFPAVKRDSDHASSEIFLQHSIGDLVHKMDGPAALLLDGIDYFQLYEKGLAAADKVFSSREPLREFHISDAMLFNALENF